MGALKDLWQSERGLVAIALIAAISVMLGLGRITSDQWTDYTKWIFLTYVGGKTITGAVAIANAKPASDLLLATVQDFLKRHANAGTQPSGEQSAEPPKAAA